MTTHELAGLMGHLRDRLGSGPPAAVSKGFAPSADAVHSTQMGNSEAAHAAFQLYCDLRDDPRVTVADLRGRFEPMRQFSKPVLQELGRELGYHYEGTKDEIVDRLRQTLEGFLMNRV